MRRIQPRYSFVFRAGATLVLMVAWEQCFFAAELTPYEVRVTSPGAPVFSGPGENFYATDTLAQGEIAEVYREQPGGWLGIRPPHDSFSWLFGRHVNVRDNGLAEVNKDNVASRIGSRINDDRNAVQVRLKKGEVVEILGEEEVDGQTWYKIAPPSGEFRWIHAQHVGRTSPAPQPRPAEIVVPTAMPIVTVPVAVESGVHVDPNVAMVSDQSTGGQTWRASPVGTATTTPPGSDIAAPPLNSNAPINSTPTATTPLAPISPNAAAPSVAPSQPAAAPPGGAMQPAPGAALSGDLARQLTELELRLSRIVAEPPAAWQIDSLRRDAEQLLSQSATASDRAAVNSTIAKVDRFAAIGRRYQQGGAPAGQPPITPIAGAVGVVAADGQRYDAIGTLRPVVSKRPGAPQFALLDERGQVAAFVTATPDMNLQPYVGQRIGVTGNRGFIPEFQRAHVTAGRVSPIADRIVR